MAPKVLPGFYWDDEKGRYFPETSRKQPKKQPVELPESSEYSFLKRQNAFRIKMERAQLVRIPFTGMAAYSKPYLACVQDGVSLQLYTLQEEQFVLVNEMRLARRVQSIHCSNDLLVIVYLPEDLDSFNVEAHAYDFKMNLINEFKILNFPLNSPIIKSKTEEFIFIDGYGQLNVGGSAYKLKGQPRALFHHDSVGTAVASTGGHVELVSNCGRVKRLKLSSSAAKRIYCLSALNSLLLVTFHDQLVLLDLETNEQSVLIEKVHETLDQCRFNEDWFYYIKEQSICFFNILNDSDSFSITLPSKVSAVFIDNDTILYTGSFPSASQT